MPEPMFSNLFYEHSARLNYIHDLITYTQNYHTITINFTIINRHLIQIIGDAINGITINFVGVPIHLKIVEL